MLVDDMQTLSEELQVAKQGGVPPLLSFIITAGTMILSFIISFFLIYPALREVFYLGFVLALFLTIGTFVILSALFGEGVLTLIQHRQSRHV